MSHCFFCRKRIYFWQNRIDTDHLDCISLMMAIEFRATHSFHNNNGEITINKINHEYASKLNATK